MWALWLLLAGGLVREVLGQTAVAEFGAFTFHSTDPAVVVALLAVLGNLARGRFDWQPYAWPVLAMAALLGVNFLRGILADPDPALLWLRANAMIALVPLLALTMRPGTAPMRAARHALLLAAAALSLLLLVRLAFGATFLMTADVTDLTANDGGRPLSAPGTMLLVLASAMLASEVLRRCALRLDPALLAALALPVLVLLTRQGTAIIAELVALAAVVLVQRSPSHGWRLVFGGLGVIAALGLIALFLAPLLESPDVQRRLGNLGTRQEVWAALTDLWPTLPLSTQLFGFAAGQQPALLVYFGGAYSYWSLSIHSMYYGSLPMMGYAGGGAFAILLAMLGWRSLRGALAHIDPLPAFPLAACLVTAIVGYSYELRNDMLVGLFMAIWWLRATAPGKVDRRGPAPAALRRQTAPPSPRSYRRAR